MNQTTTEAELNEIVGHDYMGCTDEKDIEGCDWNKQRKQLVQLIEEKRKVAFEEAFQLLKKSTNSGGYAGITDEELKMIARYQMKISRFIAHSQEDREGKDK